MAFPPVMPQSVAHDIASGRSLTFAAWAAADDDCSGHSSPPTQTGQLALSPALQQTLIQAPRQALGSAEASDTGIAGQSSGLMLLPEQAPLLPPEPEFLQVLQPPLLCAHGCAQRSAARASAPEHGSLQPPGRLSCQAAGVNGDGPAWSPAESCPSSGQEVIAWADTPAAACAADCAAPTPAHRAGTLDGEAECADKACYQEASSAGGTQSQQGKRYGADPDGQSSKEQPTQGLQDQHCTGVSAASPSHLLQSRAMSDGTRTPCGSLPAARQFSGGATYCCSPETACAAWDGSASGAFAAWQRVTVLLWQRRLQAAAPLLCRNRIR